MESNTHDEMSAKIEVKPGWRIKAGFAIFLVSIAWPLFMPVLLFFGISTGAVAKLSGVLLIAAEVMLLAAAALTGKEGFAYIKQRVFGFLKSYSPPESVSALRYKIGLVMFTVPLLFAFLAPYLGMFIPKQIAGNLFLAMGADLSLLISLFLLGGDFWDKLRALYIHGAVASMPDKSMETPQEV
ncbi:MAG: transporter suffix domain-containing protein [Desulfofustis sp. PB-SRB1]|jgi:hypothetical protein|nr:transporter suffix domain-containing protein [Desulfofustis sp. PB-SRB1]HBH30937.1 hypothetical protein [Desulfofustis sp.]